MQRAVHELLDPLGVFGLKLRTSSEAASTTASRERGLESLALSRSRR